ncbi:hypothetical protein ACHAP5_010954 [Fusarium lateritium]
MPAFVDVCDMLYGQALQRPWLPDKDLSGKTIIVTGSNVGIGFEVVKHLIKLNISTVIIACRDTKKGEHAKADITKELDCEGKVNIQVWEMNLLSNKSIVAFGQRVRSELPRLDGFIANAGVELSHFSMAEELETTLKVNVIGTFLSAIEVLPKLKETSTRHQTQTNVTFVGSMYHIMPPPEQLDFSEGVDIFEALSDKDTADMPQRYALSKLMIHQCAHELARCVSEGQTDGTQQVIVNHVNPGWCETSLTRNKPEYPLPIRLIFKLIGWTAEEGGRAVVYAALAGNETHGHYISESRVKKESYFMRSEIGRETQRRVWDSLLNRIAMADPLAPSYI